MMTGLFVVLFAERLGLNMTWLAGLTVVVG